MKLDIALTHTADDANPHFLNALEEAWHDEDFSLVVGSPGAPDSPAATAGAPSRLAELESGVDANGSPTATLTHERAA